MICELQLELEKVPRAYGHVKIAVANSPITFTTTATDQGIYDEKLIKMMKNKFPEKKNEHRAPIINIDEKFGFEVESWRDLMLPHQVLGFLNLLAKELYELAEIRILRSPAAVASLYIRDQFAMMTMLKNATSHEEKVDILKHQHWTQSEAAFGTHQPPPLDYSKRKHRGTQSAWQEAQRFWSCTRKIKKIEAEVEAMTIEQCKAFTLRLEERALTDLSYVFLPNQSTPVEEDPTRYKDAYELYSIGNSRIRSSRRRSAATSQGLHALLSVYCSTVEHERKEDHPSTVWTKTMERSPR